MANKPRENDKVRLTVDLSSALNEHLDELSGETGMSKSQLMRLAIDFLFRAQEAKEEKMKVGAWKDDKEKQIRTEREFIGL